MSEVTKENVATVTSALEEYLQRVIQTTQFNLQEFVNFMEPKFAEAGYRATPARTGGNILILHDAGVGDFILMTGAIREIRRLYPDAHITLVIFPRTLALAECCPYVDEIILNPRTCDWYTLVSHYRWNIGIARQILERRYDVCYGFVHYPETAFLMYMSGARTRITYDFPDAKKDFINVFGDVPVKAAVALETRLVPRHTYGKHSADMCFALVDHTLHVPVKNRSLEIWLTVADKTFANNVVKNLKRPLYALCMGGVGERKHYPPEKYAELLRMISEKEPAATFVILGGGDADLKSAEIVKNSAPKIFSEHVLDLTNKTNYRQSAAILALCDMYIGNDTGTMHLAAAVNCPVLMPKCFSVDLLANPNDSPTLHYAYGVPTVTVLPEHALPECAVNEPYTQYGCRSDHSHCIAQIKPSLLFKGFKRLRERIAAKNTEPLYIH